MSYTPIDLTEIRRRVDNQLGKGSSTRVVYADRRRLLAEVERLRAEVARLKANTYPPACKGDCR